MDFISFTYFIFLLITVIVYYNIPKKGQPYWLLLCGMFFYAFSSVKLSVFLIFSITITWYGALQIKKANEIDMKFRAKCYLFGCIFVQAGLLLFLKFCASPLAGRTPLSLNRFALLLPMGISFYTLQMIAYLVDIYNSKYEPQKNYFKYFLFGSYFPQILQGPIPRYDKLSDELLTEHKFDYQSFVSGLELMVWGYFQKLVVADRANIVVNRLFGEYKSYPGGYMLLAGFLYSIQLYADFNGCVCIAKGTSTMLGIHLADNFDRPYFAESIKDFWRRWHISLSTWLRDYIYIPLGGNRKGKIRKYINILITFLVSGIWHGIGVHYLFWGFLHGFYQIMGDVFMPFKQKMVKLFHVRTDSFSHRLLKQFVTFFLVMIAWIFFRASNMRQAVYMILSMRVFNPWVFWNQSFFELGLTPANFRVMIFGIIVMLVVSLLQNKYSLRTKFAEQGIVFRYLFLTAAIVFILIFGVYGPGYDSAQFIYGNF